MSEATLFLVQASFSALNTALKQLETLSQPEDTVVFMGDSVLSLMQYDHLIDLPHLTKLYILESDAKQLIDNYLPRHIHVLSYADWADVCLAHQRIMTLK